MPTTPQPVSDPGFLGVDMRDPANLTLGWCSDATNMRFNNGIAESRAGILQLWRSATPGTVHGAGVFDDPDGQRWILLAVAGQVWRWRQGRIAELVPLHAGVTLAGQVRFVQAFDAFFMLRGPDDTVLIMDDWDTGFRPVTEHWDSAAGAGTGTAPIPNTAEAIFFANRLLMVDGLDQVAVSDVLNYTRYSKQNEFRINTGSGDQITGIYEFSDSSLVVAKQNSIHLLYNLVPNEYGNYTSAARATLTNEYGIIAPRSMAQLGADLVGLSRRGVVSIRQTEENKSQSTDVALSDPIAPLIARINWAHAAGAAAAVLGNRYYLAVPLDQAEVVGDNILYGQVYDVHGSLTLATLTPGQRYRYTPAGLSISIEIAGITTAAAALDFTAVANVSVILHGTAGARVTATLKPIWQGVNNAILIYNTTNKAWEGVDISPALMVQDWLRFRYDGAERLCYLGAEGILYLYEEGTTDDVWRPGIKSRIDLLVAQLPAIGDTITIGGKSTVTVTRSNRNTATTWGCRDLTTAIANLWSDAYGAGGCNPHLAHTWIDAGTDLLPGTAWAEQISGGVRLVGTDTGAFPWIIGDWRGFRGGLAAKVYSGIAREPITAELVTRGYHYPAVPLTAFSRAWITIATWSPCLEIAYRTDGQAEETIAIAELRRDRAKYTTHGTPDYIVSNVNDDHAAPGRQDYSVLATAQGIDDLGHPLGPVTGFYLGANGINFDLMQDACQAIRCPAQARYLQLAIRNSEGRLQVKAVELDCTPGRRTGGTQY